MKKQPVEFSEDIAARIIEQMETGRTMSSICNDPGMPHRRTVNEWMRRKLDFAKLYELAKERQGDVYFDKVIDVAEGRLDEQILESIGVKFKGESPNSQRHMILAFREQLMRAYQYAAAKRNPRNYGDKQQMEISGNPDKPITTVTRIELVAPQLQIASPTPSALPVIEAKVTERERVNADPG